MNNQNPNNVNNQNPNMLGNQNYNNQFNQVNNLEANAMPTNTGTIPPLGPVPSNVNNVTENTTILPQFNNQQMPSNNFGPVPTQASLGTLPTQEVNQNNLNIQQTSPVNNMPLSNMNGNGIPNVNNNINNEMPNTPNNPQVLTNNQTNQLPADTTNVGNVSNSNFTEEKAKKKTSPIVVIAAIMLLAVGLLSGYYFILDKPNKAFSVALDKLLQSVKVESVKNNYTNYNIGFNIITENQEYKEYANIINKLSLDVTLGLDNNSNVISNGLINYNNSELLNYSAFYNKDTAYFKANNILDKVIKVDLSENTNVPSSNSSSLNETDLNTIRDSIILAIKNAMNSANYNKELAELNGKRVKKYTLIIDKAFIDNVATSLSNDTNFLNSTSKLTEASVDNIKNSLNTSNEKIETTEVSIYTSIIKNDFLKLELSNSNSKLTMVKDNDNYNYEYAENNKVIYNGYVTYKKIGNDITFNLNINAVEEAVTININTTLAPFDDIAALDTSNAIIYTELSEEEMTNALAKLQNNQALQSLMNDLGLNEDNINNLINM